ncbi:MAG: hypothetical protein LBH17_07640 [Oscillospiraceae bacterium]|nr:hypothetical protein [Oscillospiraceae bacterium]
MSRDSVRAVPLSLSRIAGEAPPSAAATDVAPPPDLPPAPPEKSAAELELEAARARIAEETEAARREADAIRAAAESEAADIRAAAELDAEHVRSEASSRGFDKGYADGEERAARDGEAELERRSAELYEANQERIGGFLASVNRELASARDELLKNVLDLSMDISRKIVGEALRQPEYLMAMINAAVSGLGVGDSLTVRLSPDAAATLFPDGVASLVVDGLEVRAIIIPDVTLTEHGLLIDFGREDKIVRADAGAETQLGVIDEQLRRLEEDSVDDAEA